MGGRIDTPKRGAGLRCYCVTKKMWGGGAYLHLFLK